MKVEYRTLEKSSVQDVHQCFITAFSDYIVDIRMSAPAFQEMNELRAVNFALSVGAFVDKQLVGLTLNAGDVWQGRPTAYDAGTGVIPGFRGQGISRGLMEKSFEVLAARGYERYLLEVITSNEKALKLYESLDFKRTRRFDCLVLKTAPYFRRVKKIRPIVDVSRDQIPRLETAMRADLQHSFEPSWQNSWNTIRRRPELYRLIACWDSEVCVGYGAIGVGRGGIAQLWVRHDLRGEGLGSRLMQELMARSPGQRSYSWVNVEDGSKATLDFLKEIGFTLHIAQYEMERSLQPKGS